MQNKVCRQQNMFPIILQIFMSMKETTVNNTLNVHKLHLTVEFVCKSCRVQYRGACWKANICEALIHTHTTHLSDQVSSGSNVYQIAISLNVAKKEVDIAARGENRLDKCCWAAQFQINVQCNSHTDNNFTDHFYPGQQHLPTRQS